MTGREHGSTPITDGLSAWANALSWDDCPEAVRRVAQYELLDIVGALIAGRSLLGLPPWLAAMIDASGGEGSGRCDAIGHAGLAPQTAALVNGYFAHALEMDDTHDLAVLHAGATVIPAVLAAHDYQPLASGRQLMEAIVVGLETVCRLGVATRLSLVEGGWLYTPLLGHFGAAAGVAKLLGGPSCADLVARSLGVVYSFTSGNHQPTREGVETKHLQPGIAASNAVSAVLMTKAGLHGVRQPFLGEDGLNRVYLRSRMDAVEVVADLGIRYEVARLSFKPYPTCRLTHPAITAALSLHHELSGNVSALARVDVQIGAQAFDVVGRDAPEKQRPATRLNAQFSVKWCVAVALRYGAVMPSHLQSEVPPSPELAALIDRIVCSADTSAGERDVGGCRVVVTGEFGERVKVERHARGHPDSPLTTDDLLLKFTNNVASAGLGLVAARQLAESLLSTSESDAPPKVIATANAAMAAHAKQRQSR